MSLEKYSYLSQKDREIFLRAAYWYSNAGKTREYSFSSAYIALVNVIECFIQTRIIGICNYCSQAIYDKSINQGFKDIIDEFAGGLDNKTKGELYGLRSSLSHGSKIMPQDDFLQNSSFTPYNFKHSMSYRLVANIVQFTLYNWLHSR